MSCSHAVSLRLLHNALICVSCISVTSYVYIHHMHSTLEPIEHMQKGVMGVMCKECSQVSAPDHTQECYIFMHSMTSLLVLLQHACMGSLDTHPVPMHIKYMHLLHQWYF